MDFNEVYLDGGLSNCDTEHLCVVFNILWAVTAVTFHSNNIKSSILYPGRTSFVPIDLDNIFSSPTFLTALSSWLIPSFLCMWTIHITAVLASTLIMETARFPELSVTTHTHLHGVSPVRPQSKSSVLKTITHGFSYIESRIPANMVMQNYICFKTYCIVMVKHLTYRLTLWCWKLTMVDTYCGAEQIKRHLVIGQEHAKQGVAI